MFDFGKPFKVGDFVFWKIVSTNNQIHTFSLSNDSEITNLPNVSFYFRGSYKSHIEKDGVITGERTIESPLTLLTRKKTVMESGNYVMTSIGDATFYCVQIIRTRINPNKNFKKREVYSLKANDVLTIERGDLLFVKGSVLVNDKFKHSTDDDICVIYNKTHDNLTITVTEDSLILLLASD